MAITLRITVCLALTCVRSQFPQVAESPYRLKSRRAVCLPGDSCEFVGNALLQKVGASNRVYATEALLDEPVKSQMLERMAKKSTARRMFWSSRSHRLVELIKSPTDASQRKAHIGANRWPKTINRSGDFEGKLPNISSSDRMKFSTRMIHPGEENVGHADSSKWHAVAHEVAHSTVGIVLATTCVFVLIIVLIWCCSSSAGNSTSGQDEHDPARSWLLMCTVATVGLLIFQIALSLSTHSMALFTDSAHTGADAVTYGCAYLVERMKGDLSRERLNLVDCIAGFFSVAVLYGVSFWGLVVAINRARSEYDQASEQDDSEFLDLGIGFIGFGIMSTLLNVALLWLRFRNASPSDEEVQPQLVDTDDEFACMPCGVAGADAGAGGEKDKSGQKKRGIDILHSLFHPGCACDSTGSAQLDPDSANLNELGVLLHIYADVARSLIVFGAGLLVIFKVVRNYVIVDACCTLLVMVCILVGSITLMNSLIQRLKRITS